MEKEFIPYEIALKLKKLGFDEPCAACYGSYTHKTSELFLNINNPVNIETLVREKTGFNRPTFYVKSPTFSQVFRWFKEKYKLMSCITPCSDGEYIFTLYDLNKCDLEVFVEDIEIMESEDSYEFFEDIELDCLKKLIEIVTNKN